MKLSHNLSINDERAVEQFAQSMIENSVEIFRAMQELQNQVRQHDVITSFSFIVFSLYRIEFSVSRNDSSDRHTNLE